MPRAPREPKHIDFKPDDRAAVIARMDGMTRAGTGWINLSPALDEDAELPVRSSTFGIFSGRGPDVPLCTWVPGTPTQLGIQSPIPGRFDVPKRFRTPQGLIIGPELDERQRLGGRKRQPPQLLEGAAVRLRRRIDQSQPRGLR